ncbi:hypothetical protein AVEN_249530-1 [Araneus ventricosus]|uniref:Uncharacterized protein n=1 Tax=Araneus ventricosus TaxID=182803 RepID=A0A4Y2UFK8_ARAVE|nr:hypothetical protein AVEN_249530-1 [Araneus ventricosus]
MLSTGSIRKSRWWRYPIYNSLVSVVSEEVFDPLLASLVPSCIRPGVTVKRCFRQRIKAPENRFCGRGVSQPAHSAETDQHHLSLKCIFFLTDYCGEIFNI